MCVNSDVGLVHSVTRHVISLLGCHSSIGKNNVSCSQFFSLPAIIPDDCCNVGYKQTIVKARDWTRFINVPVSTIAQLFQLIVPRDGVLRQFSVNVDSNVLNNDQVKSIIYCCGLCFHCSFFVH